MSNLLKRGSIISNNERVIDYNEIIKAKLKTILESNEKVSAHPDNFVSGLKADVVEELISDEEEGADVEALLQDRMETQKAQIQHMQETADKLVAEANKKAERIVADAHTQSMGMMNQAREQGYQEGMQQAEAEIEGFKAELENELEQHKRALDMEYQQLKAQMEPQLIEVLTDVFSKVTLTVAEDNKDIVLHLINGVLKNAEQSREFVIKASPDDYKFLISNQGKLYCAMTKEVTFDIIEDATLERNQCIVETDGGVFNCSLDVELSNLVKKIKLLSCL